MPKKGFTKKYAVLATNYGSNDLEFIPINEKEKMTVNAGIAHFLEHKMFEQPDETDAFEKFSKWGANANAFTNFTTTAYLFTTTENFYFVNTFFEIFLKIFIWWTSHHFLSLLLFYLIYRLYHIFLDLSSRIFIFEKITEKVIFSFSYVA